MNIKEYIKLDLNVGDNISLKNVHAEGNKMMNEKSDVKAKEEYVNVLKGRGYTNVQISSTPSDIIAFKSGKKYFFEIKVANSAKKGGGFGAATITEWEQALNTPDYFFFVMAWHNGDGIFEFCEYTPNEFMRYSTIPPFKVYFKIDRNNTRKTEHRTAIPATEHNITEMITAYDDLKKKNQL